MSPIGIGREPFWQSIASGRSGIAHVETIAQSAIPGGVGAEIKEFTEATARKTYLKAQRKSIKVMCRDIQIGVASAALALEDSSLELEQVDHTRLGVDFGANQMFSPVDVLKEACFACMEGEDQHFEYSKWGQVGMPRLEPLWLLKYLPNMPACHIGILADAQGPSNSLTHADASGNLSIGEAFRVIERGDAEIMIAGTTGTRVHEVKCLHAALDGDVADSTGPPEKWCRPFDKDRTGEVVGEAACSFVLEEESYAKARGATIFGTVLGCGASCVIDRKGTPNIRLALANAMRAALGDAGIKPEDVGHVHANGLSTKRGDVEESAAIHDVFGSHADAVPVTALKSFVGNSGAGCGTLELAASVLGLREGVVPPTLNYETPDPDCPVNVVAGTPLSTTNKIVLNVNVAPTGQASALVLCGA